jgi:hypothetical protein
VPCFGIDLMWHTHQVHPIEYNADTKRYLGYLFPHDDTVNDRAPGSQLCQGGQVTANLWKTYYNENFFFPGGMFRGDKPNGNDYGLENYDFSYFFERTGVFSLEEVVLKPQNKLLVTKKMPTFKLRIYRDNFIRTCLYEGLLTVNEPLKFSTAFDYSEYENKSLDARLELVKKDDTTSKIKNVFKHGSTHDRTTDLSFLLKLQAPAKKVEEQEFKINVGDNYVLCPKWKLTINRLVERVAFTLVQGEFLPLHMNSVRNEYRVFDFKNKNFSHDKGEAIRGHHQIMIGGSNRQLSQPYTAEIMHIMAHRWSSIRILSKNKVMATGHLINQESLPIDQQGISLSSEMVLEKFEKVMLIRNKNGDYAILKGKWNGFMPRTRRNPYGKQGSLTIKYYSFQTKKTQSFVISNEFEFSFQSESIIAIVDLKTGKITLRFLNKEQINNTEVESVLAIVFSVSVLYILLQPKVRETAPPPMNSAIPMNRSAYRPVPRSDILGIALLSSIGYMALINTPVFINTCHRPHYFDDNTFGGSGGGAGLAINDDNIPNDVDVDDTGMEAPDYGGGGDNDGWVNDTVEGGLFFSFFFLFFSFFVI